MPENTRKAVITTVQVQEALNDMNALRSEIGLPVDGTEFDKGNRGKGFAVYTDKGVSVESFETKEEAYVKFSQFVEVGNIILGASHVKVVKPEAPKTTKTAEKPAEKPAA